MHLDITQGPFWRTSRERLFTMKNSNWPRIGFAVFVGILVGSAVAVNLGNYLWWVGVLVGIAVGIFALGPIRTIRAVMQAGSIASREIREVKIDISKYCKVSTANLWRLMLWPALVAFYALTVLVLAWLFLDLYQNVLHDSFAFVSLSTVLSGMICSWISCIMVFMTEFEFPKNLKKWWDCLGMDNAKSISGSFLILFVMIHPLVFSIFSFPVICYLLYRLIKWSILAVIPALWRFSWKFAKTSFLFFHSEETVQVSTYVAIGTVVGWHFKAPFTAAVIGDIVGELSYRFLTRRFIRQNIAV